MVHVTGTCASSHRKQRGRGVRHESATSDTRTTDHGLQTICTTLPLPPATYVLYVTA